MLKHWEVLLKADYSRTGYIPFAGDYPGSTRDYHIIRLGTEQDYPHAIEWALGIFPEAKVVEVWETNILCDRIRQVWREE